MEIREARWEDRRSLVALAAQLGYGVTGEGVASVLVAGSGSCVLVAVDGVDVVGFVALDVRRPFQLGPPCAVVDAIVVDGDHRSDGIGGSLVEAACQWAVARDADRIELNSALHRDQVRRFYERHGFEVVSYHFRRDLRPASPDGPGAVVVRPLRLDEVGLRISYFHDATDEFLARLGVDRAKLPAPDAWRTFYEQDYARPIDQRENYAVAWELDGAVIGFSTVDRITFGREAFLHLHVLDSRHRRTGLGAVLVARSALHFMEVLHLSRLCSEPHAFNPAPNRTLQRAGFRYAFTHRTTPGPLNVPQTVNRWCLGIPDLPDHSTARRPH